MVSTLFAWTTIDTLSIDPKVISHKLVICKESEIGDIKKEKVGQRKGTRSHDGGR